MSKNYKKFLYIVFALPIITNASVNYYPVQDSNGNYVRDSNAKCVRSNWSSPYDACEIREDKYSRIEQMVERVIYFDFDKHNIKESEKAKLNVLADALREEGITAVKIVGYTDRIGTEDYNDKLSHKRADVVKKYLDSIIHLDSSVLQLRWLGKNNPVQICDSNLKRNDLIKCLAPNRRVEVEIDKEYIERETIIYEQ